MYWSSINYDLHSLELHYTCIKREWADTFVNSFFSLKCNSTLRPVIEEKYFCADLCGLKGSNLLHFFSWLCLQLELSCQGKWFLDCTVFFSWCTTVGHWGKLAARQTLTYCISSVNISMVCPLYGVHCRASHTQRVRISSTLSDLAQLSSV